MHGIGGNKRNWHPNMPAVARHFHAVAWDGRGWGESDDYEGPLTFEDMSGDLDRVIAHFGAERAHIVGLSLGVKAALNFVYLYPHRVASLTLCDGSLKSRRADPETLKEFVRLRQQPLLEGKEPKDIAEPVARSLVSPAAKPGALEQLIDSMSRLHKLMYLKAIELLVYTQDAPGLDRIKVPTLVVVGKDDRLTPVAEAEALVAAIAGAQLAVVENAGHLVNIEQPEAFDALLLDFLLGPARAGGR
ncbi:MAG: alpha/beta fold hydrolase [Phenylobacterium sp.]|nr:MAG: alpha/beta fold hydrolase [Phenylobacterium sp.]